MTQKNVVLIGMPGAGKSTVGVVLARRLGLNFIDTDLLIQTRRGRRLQQIIDEEGLEAFLRMEEEVLTDLDGHGAVIATGGSAVYSEGAMNSLGERGAIVFIEVALPALEKRIRNMDSRGVVMESGQTLEDLCLQRLPLYRRYAQITISDDGFSVEEMAAAIEKALSERKAKEVGLAAKQRPHSLC
jgi:shikimate kinase